MALINRRRGMPICGIVIGLAAATLFWAFWPAKYESTARVLVMKKDSKLATRGEGSEQSEQQVDEDLMSTHMEIIQSRGVIGTALKKHGYDQLSSIQSKLKQDEDAIDYVIERMDVSRGGAGQSKSAHVLNVSFQHSSPEEAENILAAIIDSYQSFLAEKFQDVSKEAAELIQEAKTVLASDVENAEAAYRDFREQAPILWKGDESANIHRVHYEELESALSDIKLKASQARARLSVVEKAVADQDARNASDLERLSLLDDDSIERIGLLVEVQKGDANNMEFQATQPARLEGAKAEHEALLNLMLKEKTLRSDFGPEHPLVEDVIKQVTATKEFLQSKDAALAKPMNNSLKLTPKGLVHSYVGLLKNDLVTLEQRRIELDKLAKEEHDAAKALVSFELRGESMRTTLERKQELYEAVLDRLREINLVKAYGGYATEVIEPVELGKKCFPLFKVCAPIGCFLGLIIGIALAAGAEFYDPMFLGPHDVVRTLDLPVFTQLPRLGVTKEGKPLVVGGASKLLPTMVAFHRPQSREAEVIRGLRTSMLFRLKGQKHRSIMFTSANPADGKTTVVANLAISIAQVGHRVLLVDCDMRRPQIMSAFGLEQQPGLADLLQGDHEPSDFILDSEVPNLSLLLAGAVPKNPGELLTSQKFAALLETLREKYDYVLIDAPPLMAVADPCIVAPLADAVVMAVRLTRDSRMQVLRSKDLLESSQANVIGIVINGYDYRRRHLLAADTYGYGYGYGLSYSYKKGYGPYDDKEIDSYYETGPADTADQGKAAVERNGKATAERNGKGAGHAEVT
jgi:capsular exopolysaccharide synthesis family protein